MTHRMSRLKCSKERRDLSNTRSHRYLTNIDRTFNPRTLVFIHFVNAHETPCKTEHELSHKLITVNFKI